MKQQIIKCIALCLMPLLLTGCWQEPIMEEKSNSLLPEEEILSESTTSRVILPEHFSLPYAPDVTLDPISCPDGMQQAAASLLYEGLFRLSPSFEAEPWLCESYTYDAATLTYTFSLRTDVVFSDSSPLTTDDVTATLNRARTSERYGSRLTGITDITAEGSTVTMTLSAPNTELPALLNIPIVKAGTEQNPAPIGTGPYLFSLENTQPWLIANQQWWRGNGQPTDRIALVEAADQDTKLYRFTSHEVQLITADLTGTDPISATGNTGYLDANTTILQYLGCNVTRAPMDNPTFRKALSAGINRSHIVSAFLSGHAKATQFPISPAAALYPVDLEIPYTHESLATELERAGYMADRTLTLLVNEENAFKVSVAQYLAETFAAAGVPMEAKVLPWEEYTAALASGDFDLYYGEVKLSADWDLTALLAAGGSLNYGGWANSTTDNLLSAFAASEDRSPSARTLCLHLQQSASILPLCFKSTSVLIQTDVLEGLHPTMAEPFYNLTDCTIHLQSP